MIVPDLSLRAVFAFTAAVAIFVAVGLTVIVVDHHDRAVAQSACRKHGEVVLMAGGEWRCMEARQ